VPCVSKTAGLACLYDRSVYSEFRTPVRKELLISELQYAEASARDLATAAACR